MLEMRVVERGFGAAGVVVFLVKVLANAIEAVQLVVYCYHQEVGVWVVRCVDGEDRVFAHATDISSADCYEGEASKIVPCRVDFW